MKKMEKVKSPLVYSFWEAKKKKKITMHNNKLTCSLRKGKGNGTKIAHWIRQQTMATKKDKKQSNKRSITMLSSYISQELSFPIFLILQTKLYFLVYADQSYYSWLICFKK
jgi:hypothetical protein